MKSEITEILDEVFIKEVGDDGIDRVSFVQNVPRRFFYAETPKMVMKRDKEGYAEGHMVPRDPLELEWTLKDGLEYSLNGDGSILFQVRRAEAKDALAALDDYIDRSIERGIVIPDRIPYPMDVKDPRSNPKPKEMIPKIKIPLVANLRGASDPISPVGASAPASERPSRHFTADHKEKMRQNLVKARAARGLKKK